MYTPLRAFLQLVYISSTFPRVCESYFIFLMLLIATLLRPACIFNMANLSSQTFQNISLKYDNEGMLRQAPTSTLSKVHLTSIANKPVVRIVPYVSTPPPFFLTWRRLDDDDMNNERCRNLEDRNMRLLSFADVRSARCALIVQTRGAERGHRDIDIH